MKILLAASEALPYCHTGQLGETINGLALALKQKRHDVRLVLPKYRSISPTAFGLKPLKLRLILPLGDNYETVSLWEGRLAHGTPVYFVDAPKYFDREGLYRDADGRDFPDNDERFIVFSRAVLETAKALDFRPDVIHCHDWQTGLVPAYLQTVYRIDSFFIPTSSLFTIHNVAYQGLFPKNTLFLAGFSWADFSPDKLEYYGQMNFLKAGIVSASVVNTVSPTYGNEIQNNSAYGCGMEGILKTRSNDVFAVLNGIDTKQWDPLRDAHLIRRYSARQLDLRSQCRADLQRAVGLDRSSSAPLIAVISPLDRLRGHDMTLEVIEEFLADDVQFLAAGAGEESVGEGFASVASRFPGRVAYQPEMDESLLHKIYGGADILLIPSRLEPCGSEQMIGLRYGAVPVVTPEGGLKDTIVPWNEKTRSGTGFVASDVSVSAIRETLQQAVSVFKGHPDVWREIVRRGMARSFKWSDSAARYLELFRLAVSRKQ